MGISSKMINNFLVYCLEMLFDRNFFFTVHITKQNIRSYASFIWEYYYIWKMGILSNINKNFKFIGNTEALNKPLDSWILSRNPTPKGYNKSFIFYRDFVNYSLIVRQKRILKVSHLIRFARNIHINDSKQNLDVITEQTKYYQFV